MASTDGFLYQGEPNPNDGRLRDPTVAPVSFPTQYDGLDWEGLPLCVVAVADAPPGMGNVFTTTVNGVERALYIVETNDTNASVLTAQTTLGTKAIRKKT